jgi:glucose-fructose oxidoreductase
MRTSNSKSNNKKIRYAVVGLGHISQVAALPAFKNAKENSELVGFVTSDPEKAKVLQKKYKVPRVVSYRDYEGYLKSGAVDAVYIALPNDLHYEYTKIALNCGVHVLCEKPFTLESKQAKELQQLADRKKLKLMVAYRLHFEAANLRAIELAQSGKLGDLKYFTSNFSFQLTDPNNIRLKTERGGGPTWDIGIYCINAARYIFKAEPLEVTALAEKSADKRFKEVNETVSVIMRFPENRLASITYSFGASDMAWYTLVGTKGYLCLDSAYEYAEGHELEYDLGEGVKTQKYKKTDQFGPEFVYFSDCILKNRAVEPSGLEGFADIAIVEAILESIRTHKTVKLRSNQKVKLMRPSKKQQIFRFAIPKGEEVKVRGPH